MTGGRRWEIQLLSLSRVGLKLQAGLEPASEARQASQGSEIPGVKRCGSTSECVPEPRLHTGAVAGSRWLLELHIMRRGSLGAGGKTGCGVMGEGSESEAAYSCLIQKAGETAR